MNACQTQNKVSQAHSLFGIHILKNENENLKKK